MTARSPPAGLAAPPTLVLSGSVALLADTIHNFADAATAIPLALAFWLTRRGASRGFTYGLGRVKDFAGLAIIATILSSACVALYGALTRLVHPQPVHMLWAVVMASVVGFAGPILGTIGTAGAAVACTPC